MLKPITSLEETRKLFERFRSIAAWSWPASYAKHVAMVVGSKRGEQLFGGIQGLSTVLEPVLSAKLETWHTFSSGFFRHLATIDVRLGIEDRCWYLAHIDDVPLVWADHFAGKWLWCPLSEHELLLQLARAPRTLDTVQGDIEDPSLRFTDEVAFARAPMQAETRRVVDLTRTTPGCRVWLLAGPPGGGKTTAAMQVASTIGAESRLTVSPSAQADPAAWDLIHALKPAALVLDDVDTTTGRAEEQMIFHLPRVRSYAKVVIQTANVTDRIRGALLAPHRTNEAIVRYDSLAPEVAAQIAPSLTTAEREAAAAAGLMATQMAELELRARAQPRRDISAGITELSKRMEKCGNR